MFQESKELTVTTSPRIGVYHDLAQAIRLGCALRPRQGFGKFLRDDDRACALGAVLAANGIIPSPAKRRALLLKLHPALSIKLKFPPRIKWRYTEAKRSDPLPMIEVIAGLNDDFRWSRERIANWLDSLQ
jgi:hypothetical protein